MAVGSSVRLECPAWGYAAPNISWYRDGRALDAAATLRVSQRGRVLALTGVRLRDRARYQCTAVNEHGAASRSTLLRVTGVILTLCH